MLHFKFKSPVLGMLVHDPEELEEYFAVREAFKTKNDTFAMKSYYSDPFVYAISPLGQYAIGLTASIMSTCDRLGIVYDIEDKLLEICKPSIQTKDKEILPVPNEEYKYRYYQDSLIKSLLDNGRGIIVSPTRSGKSLVIAGLIRNIFARTEAGDCNLQNILIVVPNVQLVDQFYEDLKEYGLGSICNIQQFTATVMNKKGAKINVDTFNIYIANAQYLLGHGNELPVTDVIFCDEVHTIAGRGSAISKLVKKIPVNYKFGCTGTLPKNQHSFWQLEGIFGPILDEVKIQELQENKILANVKIYNLKFMHKKKVNFLKEILPDFETASDDKKKEAYKDVYSHEAQFLGMHDFCNRKTLDIVVKVIEKNPEWNALVLFDYTEQGHDLFDKLDYEKKHYVDGKIKVEDRKEVINEMNNSGGNITVAQSKVFSTGLTISRINLIVIMTTTSANTKIIQSIGRGLRRQNKEDIVIFDVNHNYKYSEKHFKERMALYKEFYGLEYGKDYSTKTIESND